MGPDATPTDHPEVAAAGPDSFATDHWDELLCDQMRAPLIDNDEPPQDQMRAVPIDREEPRTILSLPRLISGAAFLNGGRPPLFLPWTRPPGRDSILWQGTSPHLFLFLIFYSTLVVTLAPP